MIKLPESLVIKNIALAQKHIGQNQCFLINFWIFQVFSFCKIKRSKIENQAVAIYNEIQLGSN